MQLFFRQTSFSIRCQASLPVPFSVFLVCVRVLFLFWRKNGPFVVFVFISSTTTSDKLRKNPKHSIKMIGKDNDPSVCYFNWPGLDPVHLQERTGRAFILSIWVFWEFLLSIYRRTKSCLRVTAFMSTSSCLPFRKNTFFSLDDASFWGHTSYLYEF